MFRARYMTSRPQWQVGLALPSLDWLDDAATGAAHEYEENGEEYTGYEDSAEGNDGDEGWRAWALPSSDIEDRNDHGSNEEFDESEDTGYEEMTLLEILETVTDQRYQSMNLDKGAQRYSTRAYSMHREPMTEMDSIRLHGAHRPRNDGEHRLYKRVIVPSRYGRSSLIRVLSSEGIEIRGSLVFLIPYTQTLPSTIPSSSVNRGDMRQTRHRNIYRRRREPVVFSTQQKALSVTLFSIGKDEMPKAKNRNGSRHGGGYITYSDGSKEEIPKELAVAITVVTFTALLAPFLLWGVQKALGRDIFGAHVVLFSFN